MEANHSDKPVDRSGPGLIESLLKHVLNSLDNSAKELVERTRRDQWGDSNDGNGRQIMHEAVLTNMTDSFVTNLLKTLSSGGDTEAMLFDNLRGVLWDAICYGEKHLSAEKKKELVEVLLEFIKTGTTYDHLKAMEICTEPFDVTKVVHVRPKVNLVTVGDLVKTLAKFPPALVTEPVTLTILDPRTPGERLKIEPATY